MTAPTPGKRPHGRALSLGMCLVLLLGCRHDPASSPAPGGSVTAEASAGEPSPTRAVSLPMVGLRRLGDSGGAVLRTLAKRQHDEQKLSAEEVKSLRKASSIFDQDELWLCVFVEDGDIQVAPLVKTPWDIGLGGLVGFEISKLGEGAIESGGQREGRLAEVWCAFRWDFVARHRHQDLSVVDLRFDSTIPLEIAVEDVVPSQVAPMADEPASSSSAAGSSRLVLVTPNVGTFLRRSIPAGEGTAVTSLPDGWQDATRALEAVQLWGCVFLDEADGEARPRLACLLRTSDTVGFERAGNLTVRPIGVGYLQRGEEDSQVTVQFRIRFIWGAAREEADRETYSWDTLLRVRMPRVAS